MAKDYGKRRPMARRSSAPKQLFWLLASFLSGYLAATVFDFTSLSSWVSTNILTKQNNGKAQAQVAIKEPELPKPKFEFYTLLAKDRGHPAPAPAPVAKLDTPPPLQQVKPQTTVQPSVLAQKPNTNAPLPQPAKTIAVAEARAVASSNKDAYLIQLAAFKNKQDAEHMKAALTLKGFNVTVIASAQQQGTWFRVVAGPFSSRAIAEKTQINLAQNERIKGMIRRMEG